jgi:hypothetical protein
MKLLLILILLLVLFIAFYTTPLNRVLGVLQENKSGVTYEGETDLDDESEDEPTSHLFVGTPKKSSSKKED